MEPPRPTLPVFSNSQISTPLRPSRPASVTTNDGIFSQTTIRPSIAEMAVVRASPVTMASQTGNGWLIDTIQTVIRPPIAALKPTDRSISPSSRIKVWAIAMVMIQPAWPIRLAMLVADRKLLCVSWK